MSSRRLKAFAQDHGHSILELAIAWLAAKPAVASVIAGATKPEQVRANVKAADWALTDEEVREVDAIVPPAASAGVKRRPRSAQDGVQGCALEDLVERVQHGQAALVLADRALCHDLSPGLHARDVPTGKDERH